VREKGWGGYKVKKREKEKVSKGKKE